MAVPPTPPERAVAQVISVIEVPATDPARAGKMDVLITYRVDPLHTFTIRLPAEGLTPEKVDAAVRADWASRKQYINRQITL